MQHWNWRLFASILLLSMLIAVSIAQQRHTTRMPNDLNVILIGWDGAGRERVRQCLQQGELPHLAQLASEGKLVAIDILRTTDTKAGWTQILTGYEPEKTGVYSNARYQPIPPGYTLFERLEQHFGKDRIATVAVMGKRGNVDADPPTKVLAEPIERRARAGRAPAMQRLRQGKIITENGVRYLVEPGKPFYHARQAMDVFINGLIRDDAVGEKTLEMLERYQHQRFFFFVHFAEIDHQGHQYGENSKQYIDALKSADRWLGNIVWKLKELGLYEKTLIYVTSDHGFDRDRNTHADAPYVFLATNDAGVMRRGTRADIAPTILHRFGIDPKKLDPPLDGHPLTQPYRPPIW
ncbi:MAG: alkaline phosphatase family protein [Armatimonadetes bacterium]|nr:alkaline phosphatase family protein [Armatimonadota bacterium]